MNHNFAEQMKGESKMGRLIRRSANEYRRQINRKDAFLRRTERIAEVLRFAEGYRPSGCFGGKGLEQNLLLLTMTLFEPAWADGAINDYEQDAILQAADVYGLIDNPTFFKNLTQRLGSRPNERERERLWRDIRVLCAALDDEERGAIVFCLREQADYVAAQSQRWMLGYWRGRQTGEREEEVLRDIAKRLEQIKNMTKPELIEMNKKIFATDSHKELTPLVPLVKVAWADGQVTRRERHLVYEIAARTGIKPGSAAFHRLESWLELHPTDDFYERSLNSLREQLSDLPPDVRDQRKFDLLADCADLAAASGGSTGVRGGGARICDEEIRVVKRIAKKLNWSNSSLL